jgi:hypothetical protein
LSVVAVVAAAESAPAQGDGALGLVPAPIGFPGEEKKENR